MTKKRKKRTFWTSAEWVPATITADDAKLVETALRGIKPGSDFGGFVLSLRKHLLRYGHLTAKQRAALGPKHET